MGFLFAIFILIVLVYTFIFSLINLATLGTMGYLLAILSGLGLYKIFKVMYKAFKADIDDTKRSHAGRSISRVGSPVVRPDVFELMFLEDFTTDTDSDSWDDEF